MSAGVFEDEGPAYCDYCELPKTFLVSVVWFGLKRHWCINCFERNKQDS